MKIMTENWGHVEGQEIPVRLFTIENSQGMTLSVTNYGCIVTSLIVPDKNGQSDDVVLGFESLDKYVAGHPFFGAIAGRYANRIDIGRYELDGKVFQLETNEAENGNHLHGGNKGFDKFVWDWSIEDQGDAVFVHFYRLSPNGESGYGGNLHVEHTIGLDEKNQVHYDFKATTDQPTVINLVNHSYYNLAGHDKGSTNEHTLQLFADFYTPVVNGIPTGEIRSVAGTGLDFTKATLIASNSAMIEEEGFDHNFVLNQHQKEGGYHRAADLFHAGSGRRMVVLTTQPAVQFYNAFKLASKPWIGRHGQAYGSCDGICLETQHFPDSPNRAHFPTTRLQPGKVFEQKTLHRFSIED